MLNLLSPQEYVRGSFTYIRIVFFFYGAFSWSKNAIKVSFKFSELGLYLFCVKIERRLMKV